MAENPAVLQTTSNHPIHHDGRPTENVLPLFRRATGESQIWTLEPSETSTSAKKITNISTGADGPVWSPDGKWLAFTSEVYPECKSDDCNKQRAEKAAASKVKAKIADRLLFRHWSSWKEGKRSHVFVASADSGEFRDLTPGDYDAPPFSLGGQVDYAFSPDSKELAFARNTDKDELDRQTAIFSLCRWRRRTQAHHR
jgi:Tol biopolymer transport system component